jgi:renalase
MLLLTMATSASLDCSLLQAGFSDNPLDAVRVFSFPKVEKRRYVGVPGMNSICKALSLSEGVQANYGVTVTGLEWRKDGLWNVKAKDGESLGVFDAVIIADKGLASARFLAQTGLPPPLEGAGVPELTKRVAAVTTAPCFALMLAFAKPLTLVRIL